MIVSLVKIAVVKATLYLQAQTAHINDWYGWNLVSVKYSWVLQKSAHRRSYFSHGHKYNYINACTVEMHDLRK